MDIIPTTRSKTPTLVIRNRALITRLIKPMHVHIVHLYRFLLFHADPFVIQLCYFIFTSTFGFLLLMALPTRSRASGRPSGFNLFFMSVSASTVSSMDSVEMETFSDSQLAVLTLLMLTGGEVFTSMLGLYFVKIRHEKKFDTDVSPSGRLAAGGTDHQLELPSKLDVVVVDPHAPVQMDNLKLDSVRRLFFVVLSYLLFSHFAGVAFILVYLGVVPGARDVLQAKGIPAQMFAVFTTVSSFANCGFVPTNENMIAFRACSGLLLIVAGQILAGNTLYPWCLRSVLLALKRLTKKQEYEYILKNHKELGYDHLMPGLHAAYLALTVAAFLALQFIVICCMEWRSEGMAGLSTYQKLVGALFLSVNSRHSGESIVDLSTVSPAILAIFVVMMYLPPSTRFVSRDDGESGAELEDEKFGKKNESFLKKLTLSPLSYLALFTIIIAVTERKQLKEDPLNFNILNIVIEVVSAYGNVGYSTGYSCKRRLTPDNKCNDSWVGFSGRCSSEGKLALILVMLFGRLKKFAMAGGKAWKLD